MFLGICPQILTSRDPAAKSGKLNQGNKATQPNKSIKSWVGSRATLFGTPPGPAIQLATKPAFHLAIKSSLNPTEIPLNLTDNPPNLTERARNQTERIAFSNAAAIAKLMASKLLGSKEKDLLKLLNPPRLKVRSSKTDIELSQKILRMFCLFSHALLYFLILSGQMLKNSVCLEALCNIFCSGKVYQGAPKEWRSGRAEKRLSKRVFLESPFLLCSLKVCRTFQVF